MSSSNTVPAVPTNYGFVDLLTYNFSKCFDQESSRRFSTCNCAIKCFLLLWSIFSTFFYHFYPTLHPLSFSSHTHDSWTTKTRHKKSSYWYKDMITRLYCIQDGCHIRWNTTSMDHLFYNPWTSRGYVKFLNRPIGHHLFDPPLLMDHIWDLQEEGWVMAQCYNHSSPTNRW